MIQTIASLLLLLALLHNEADAKRKGSYFQFEGRPQRRSMEMFSMSMPFVKEPCVPKKQAGKKGKKRKRLLNHHDEQFDFFSKGSKGKGVSKGKGKGKATKKAKKEKSPRTPMFCEDYCDMLEEHHPFPTAMYTVFMTLSILDEPEAIEETLDEFFNTEISSYLSVCQEDHDDDDEEDEDHHGNHPWRRSLMHHNGGGRGGGGTILKTEFDATYDDTPCVINDPNLKGMCATYYVGTVITYDRGDPRQFENDLVLTMREYCGMIASLPGVESAFDPCPFIEVEFSGEVDGGDDDDDDDGDDDDDSTGRNGGGDRGSNGPDSHDDDPPLYQEGMPGTPKKEPSGGDDDDDDDSSYQNSQSQVDGDDASDKRKPVTKLTDPSNKTDRVRVAISVAAVVGLCMLMCAFVCCSCQHRQEGKKTTKNSRSSSSSDGSRQHTDGEAESLYNSVDGQTTIESRSSPSQGSRKSRRTLRFPAEPRTASASAANSDEESPRGDAASVRSSEPPTLAAINAALSNSSSSISSSSRSTSSGRSSNSPQHLKKKPRLAAPPPKPQETKNSAAARPTPPEIVTI